MSLLDKKKKKKKGERCLANQNLKKGNLFMLITHYILLNGSSL